MKKSPLLTAAVVAVALTFAPSVANAQTDLGRPAGTSEIKKALKRLDLAAPKTSRSTAKRPPRNAPHVKPVRAGSAIYNTGECAINPIIDYFSNSTVLPYTWRTFQSGGVWYGYELFSRYGWRTEWPSGYDRPSIRTCTWALGHQYEMFRWNGSRWVWYSTVNSDLNGNLRTVR
jgi:hypothetical protein